MFISGKVFLMALSLTDFGWNSFFATQLPEGSAGRTGRIASSNREHFLIWTETGDVEARVSGRFRESSVDASGESSALGDWPAVGDWVVLRKDAPVIERVLERRSRVSRKRPGKEMREQILAANIDVLFIVTALDHDYNPRRLERYLVLARESGARPVILINKSDKAQDFGHDVESIVREMQLASPGNPVLLLAAKAGKGLETLPTLLARGETAALIGSSGVGKSTIVNALLGTQRQTTNVVRKDDSRGQHTTTARELFIMPGGWLLMDLPGLREIQLWAEPVQVENSFDDIQQLVAQCRFRDCTHNTEPGCAVRDGSLDPGRLDNFRKMQKEAEYLERKSDPRAARDARQRWKSIEKSVKSHPKRDGK